jgi:beta-lactamase regulating signal transducer with metallopeptidase domain
MTHHWEALGWTLVHFLWQGAAIALVYRVADRALARHSANARYVLALAALLGMLAVSVSTLAYEEASYYQSAPPAGFAAPHFILAAQPVAAPLSETARPQQPTPIDRMSLQRLMPYLDALWLAGVLFLSMRALGGWWLIRRLHRRTHQRAPHTLLLRLDVLRRQMGIRRLVDLRLSERIASPFTAGVLRPWILLPVTALTGLSSEQLEVVLFHELAHIRRADYLWNLLQTMVETLFFFHPAVWWISRRVREERELSCDDIAVTKCSNPALYASALLRIEEERRSRLQLAMALDGHQSRAGLRARILRILGTTEARPRGFRPVSLAGIAVALLVFLCPLPKVFASFRAIPKVATSIAPIASNVAHHVVYKATHPALQAAAPTPKPSADVPAPTPNDDQQNPSSEPAQNAEPKTTAHSDYIDEMRAAGYDVDLDKYIAMKVQGITPAYAAEMSKEFGGAKLSADKLIALKVQDITPDYIAKMRAAGFDAPPDKYIAMRVQDVTPEYAAEMEKATGAKLSIDRLIAMRVQDVTPAYISKMHADGYDADPDKLIAMRVQDVTPEYADAMAKVGFGKPTTEQLIALKVQDVTPEYAVKLHADGIEATSFNDLIKYRIFDVSPEFVAGMKSAGFDAIPAKKLVELRVQGVTPEFAKGIRGQFPGATVDDVVKMRIFNIDEAFIASAKNHGFEPLTIEKLVKLRISGILDDADQKKESQP